MLTEQQYEILRELAEEIDKPLSVLIRETVQQSLLVDLERRRKQKALAWMTAQGLPVDDWEVMEHQIESRWEEDQDE
jgi:predicted transcriptional regulator